MSEPEKKPRQRNVAFRTAPAIHRKLRAEADRQAERLGLGGPELRGHKFLLNRLVREFLGVDDAERDRRIDVGMAIEQAEAGASKSVDAGNMDPVEVQVLPSAPVRLERIAANGDADRKNPAPKRPDRPKRRS